MASIAENEDDVEIAVEMLYVGMLRWSIEN